MYILHYGSLVSIDFVSDSKLREPQSRGNIMFSITPTEVNDKLSALLNISNSHGQPTKNVLLLYDDVIKWKHFPSYWPFVRGIHRWPVNTPHKGQWRGALMFALICAWINGWVSNCEAGVLRRHWAHHGVTVMCIKISFVLINSKIRSILPALGWMITQMSSTVNIFNYYFKFSL